MIERIDQIAYQIRILAMNAVIEAEGAALRGLDLTVVPDLVSIVSRQAGDDARFAIQGEVGSGLQELADSQLHLVTAMQSVLTAMRAFRR